MSDNKKFTMQNGILYENGKPVFCVGLSYYASYHLRKVPYPPEYDRISLALDDVRNMAAAGFNLVRCAALGDIWRDKDSGEVRSSTPLLDGIAEACEKENIALMLRLQGYTMNLSGYENILMLDQNNNPMDTKVWYNFVQNTFFPEGILCDNTAGTKQLAEHFADYPSVVGFQTYNEPHYPGGQMYDYHPDTVAAYRRWLAEKGYMSAEDAQNIEPPRSRPAGKNEDARPWVLWRLFSMQALSDFLCDCSDTAKDATALETLTCLTTDMTSHANASRGVNFFQCAERMDALGITQYYCVTKPECYRAAMNLTLAESAAAVYGKPYWIIEYNANTKVSPALFRRETYMALGSAVKGLLYYQWRGDYIFPDSPEGDGFGILHYDGKPTEAYDTACAAAKMMNTLSDTLVTAQKHRAGVAILHSDYAYMFADGKENGGVATGHLQLRNSWQEETLSLFTELSKEGIIPDFVRAEDLAENLLNVRLLFVPNFDYLPAEEKEAVKAFEANGGKVVVKALHFRYGVGYVPLAGYKPAPYTCEYDIADALEWAGIAPAVTVTNENGKSQYYVQLLENDTQYIVCLTNIDNLPHGDTDICIKMAADVSGAEQWKIGEEPLALDVKENAVTLCAVGDGAIVVFQKK